MEILSPASNMEHIKVAIDNKANAVYGGLKQWNARNKAINFSEDEYELLINKLHNNNIKFYLTLNILMLDNEILEVVKFLHYHTLPDSFIVADIGLIEVLKKEFPNVPLHFSTQFGCHSIDDVNFVESLGGKRAILARELTLSELNKIKENTNIELESFIWGSQCLSFSGLCFFGTLFCGGGGNRGKCIITCRDMYSINDEKGNYLYVPDMNCINLISKLNGIDCFKLEGRRRKPSEIESILKEVHNLKTDDTQVGYLYGTSIKENNQYEKINSRIKPVMKARDLKKLDKFDVCFYYENDIPIKLSNDFESDNVYYVYSEKKNSWDYEKKNISLDLTINNNIISKILYVNYKGDGHTFENKETLDLVEVDFDKLFDNTIFGLKNVNVYKIKYQKNYNDKYFISKKLYDEVIDYINSDCKDKLIIKHNRKDLKLNKIYIELKDEKMIAELINDKFIKIIYNITSIEQLKKIEKIVKKYPTGLIYKLPLFNFKSENIKKYLKYLQNQEVMFTRLTQIYLTKDINFKKKYIDYTIYVWNHHSLQYLKDNGIEEFTSSPELSYEDNCKIFENNNTQFIVGGRLPLVFTRGCFSHLFGCQNCLKDRNNVKNICNYDKKLNFQFICEDDHRILINKELFLNDYTNVDFNENYSLRYVPIGQTIEEIKMSIKCFKTNNYYKNMKKTKVWQNSYECNLFESKS